MSQAYERSLDVFLKIAKKLIRTDSPMIVEIGARDCTETLVFKRALPKAEILTFECNPDTLPICRERVAGIEGIELVEKAVSDKAGTLSFYKVREGGGEGWNPGASSLFKANAAYPEETYRQEEIFVEATTLEAELSKRGIGKVDILWMDIQGAEIKALQGAGRRLESISLIQTEVEFFPIYEGQPLFKDVLSFMRENGFQLLTFSSMGKFAGDAVFVNKRLYKRKTPEWLTIVYHTAKERVIGKARGARRRLTNLAKKNHALHRAALHLYGGALNLRALTTEGPARRRYYAEIERIKKDKRIVLDLEYGGLGDWLLFTSLPRLLKERYDVDFYITERSLERVRSRDTFKLCFELNPYFKGVTGDGPVFRPMDFAREKPIAGLLLDLGNESVTERIERQFGVSDRGRPEIYYKPKSLPEYRDVVFVDKNFISGKKLGWVYDEKSFDREISRHLGPGGEVRYVDVKSQGLFDYADAIHSCRRFITVLSGGAALSAALDKPFTALLPLTSTGGSVEQFVFKRSLAEYVR